MKDRIPKANQPKKFFSDKFVKKTIGWWKEKKREVRTRTHNILTPTGRIVNPPNAWSNWNIQYTISSNTTVGTNVVTWPAWNGNTFNQMIRNNLIIWQSWNQGTNTYSTIETPLIQLATNEWPAAWLNGRTGDGNWPARWLDARPVGEPLQPARHIVARTPEEIAAQQERERQTQERYRREYEAMEAGRKLADAKAKKILLEHLTPEQRDQYEKFQFFDLDVGGKTYRIKKGWSGNVQRIGKDEKQQDMVLESFCIHPPEIIPQEDNLLAQKLLLETAEEEFRRIANITVHYGGRYLQGRA